MFAAVRLLSSRDKKKSRSHSGRQYVDSQGRVVNEHPAHQHSGSSGPAGATHQFQPAEEQQHYNDRGSRCCGLF